MLWRLVVLTITCAATILSTATVDAQQPARVQLSIGIEGGDTLLELDGVTSALQLTNGEIVVANSRTFQLRWYSASGKFVRSVGRRGQGPDEFGNRIFLFEGRADTVVVLSGRRIYFVDRAGTFARTETLDTAHKINWSYDRTVIERAPLGLNTDRMRSVVSAIPFAPEEFGRRGVPDNAGNLWLRTGTAPAGDTWSAYGAGGRIVRSMILPVAFEVFQIRDSLVLGLERDSLGVERVQVRSMGESVARPASASGQQPPAPPRSLYDSQAELKANAELIVGMKRDLRNALTAQEVYFSENMRYSASGNKLAIKMTPGVELRVVRADNTGMWMMASHPSMKATCTIMQGSIWNTGLVICG